jgi:hypothetical protein
MQHSTRLRQQVRELQRQVDELNANSGRGKLPAPRDEQDARRQAPNKTDSLDDDPAQPPATEAANSLGFDRNPAEGKTHAVASLVNQAIPVSASLAALVSQQRQGNSDRRNVNNNRRDRGNDDRWSNNRWNGNNWQRYRNNYRNYNPYDNDGYGYAPYYRSPYLGNSYYRYGGRPYYYNPRAGYGAGYGLRNGLRIGPNFGIYWY